MAEKWRKGRTARYTQVSETVRRTFTLKPKGASALRANLKEIYRYRDLAVHPSGRIEAPMHHNDRSCHGSGHEYSIDFLVQNDKDNTGAFFAFIDNITNMHISGTNRPANTFSAAHAIP
jgi:hypothetical protein